MREIPFGQDGDFNEQRFQDVVNANLANSFGNLVSRCLGLLKKGLQLKVSGVCGCCARLAHYAASGECSCAKSRGNVSHNCTEQKQLRQP